MKKRLMSTYLVLILITMCITIGVSWFIARDYFMQRIEMDSEVKIQLLSVILSDSFRNESFDYNNFVLEYSEKIDARITILDEEGVVLADSSSKADEMDNHKNRTEVIHAIQNGKIYSNFRYSSTLKSYYQYVAVPIVLDDTQFLLRIATPYKEIEGVIMDIIQMMAVGIVIGAVISIAIAYYLTDRFTKPINQLTEETIRISEGLKDDKIYLDGKNNINKLTDAINVMTLRQKMNLWILEQKNAEQESILASMNTGIIAIDHDLKIGIYNQNFIEMFDINDKNIEGKLFYEVTRNLVVFELVEKCMEEHEMIVREAKWSNGQVDKTYLIYANPIIAKTRSNKNLGVLLSVQDVTQMRKLENLRSDFVSNVTHELKTPLTSIRGFVDTLKTGAIHDEKVAKRFLEIIEIEAERLEVLIQDVLILSEIEAMLGDRSVDEYDLGVIINDVVEMLAPKASEKGIEILKQIDEEVPKYRCNQDRIKQLLINLIENAIKYTDEGFVKVALSFEYKYLVIEVSDSGIGIGEEHLPRLTERFYRVDRGRSRATGGTGLGLSIVKHIVELYNGKIKIESKLGEGTKMTVRLPIEL